MEEFWVGTVRLGPRHHQQWSPVQFLQLVAQHRPIDVVEHVVANLEDRIWTGAENIAVECDVMKFAESQAV